MLALVASIHVLDTACHGRRRGWSGQARPWREKAAKSDFGPPSRETVPKLAKASVW